MRRDCYTMHEVSLFFFVWTRLYVIFPVKKCHTQGSNRLGNNRDKGTTPENVLETAESGRVWHGGRGIMTVFGDPGEAHTIHIEEPLCSYLCSVWCS